MRLKKSRTIYERKATRTNDGSKLTQLKAMVDCIDNTDLRYHASSECRLSVIEQVTLSWVAMLLLFEGNLIF